MGNDLDLIKRTVVLAVAVIFALGNGTADGLVGGIALTCAASVFCFVHNGIPFRSFVIIENGISAALF